MEKWELHKRLEQIRTTTIPRSKDEQLKVIWCWIKQGNITLKDFKALINEIYD